MDDDKDKPDPIFLATARAMFGEDVVNQIQEDNTSKQKRVKTLDWVVLVSLSIVFISVAALAIGAAVWVWLAVLD